MTLNKESQSLQDIAREAIAVQDACNLSGVTHGLIDALAVLREHGINDTKELNRHPIVTLFTNKLASLNGTDCVCMDCLDAYRAAMKQVEKLDYIAGKCGPNGGAR